jgi:soluble P-type ATPase
MIRIDIPGYGVLELEHLVSDVNGTLAADGWLLPGVDERLRRLANLLHVHVVTADTFGRVREQLAGAPCRLEILGPVGQTEAKRCYVEALGSRRCAALGNGRNDSSMLKAAALGIAVIGEEGAAVETLQSARVVCRDALSALDLLLSPLRLTATLRS